MRYDNGFFYVGDRKYPTVDHWDKKAEYFRAVGVRLGFENRWKLSIIWGSMTYSSNYSHPHTVEEFIEEPACVEVGILQPEDGFLLDGDVIGYCEPPMVLDIIDRVKQYPSHDWVEA